MKGTDRYEEIVRVNTQAYLVPKVKSKDGVPYTLKVITEKHSSVVSFYSCFKEEE